MISPRTAPQTGMILLSRAFVYLLLVASTGLAFAQPITLQLRVQPWKGYTVESSGDLNRWTSGQRVFATNAALDVAVRTLAGLPRQFFRARETSNDYFSNRFNIDGFPATVFGSDANASSERYPRLKGHSSSPWPRPHRTTTSRSGLSWQVWI